MTGRSSPVFARVAPKGIRTHNEDGSYTYGYEGADGSFKIETKLATGEVKGKYGYVDENGKVKVVEYGANKYGFQPSGEGITVPPPTLVDETTGKDDLLDEDNDNVPLAPRQQYVQRSHFAGSPAPAGPAPPRAQVPNAVPVDVVYSPKQLPARPDADYRSVGPQTFPGVAPEPKIRFSQPAFAQAALPRSTPPPPSPPM
ncbi:AGAP000345-PA-like protein [Anopheles sinensis]|uniref:AGAP000345-PA-like protein n=1 Tax=Anopheles sinensis TaxID=74873 RepID=A0A084VN33_ANOSI|nr:AGAP000345-PA-like protein [Anopheles sinensis]